jgi:hypothetical protein
MRGFTALIVCLGLAAASAAVARPPKSSPAGRPFAALDAESDGLRAEINALRSEIEELRSEAAETVKSPLLVDSEDRVLGPLAPVPFARPTFLGSSWNRVGSRLAGNGLNWSI